MLARHKLSREPQAVKAATDLGKASYIVSIVGMFVVGFIVFLVLIIIVSSIVSLRSLGNLYDVEFLFSVALAVQRFIRQITRRLVSDGGSKKNLTSFVIGLPYSEIRGLDWCKLRHVADTSYTRFCVACI